MPHDSNKRLSQKSDEKLTLSLLKIHIPIIKTGDEAAAKLKENPKARNKSELMYLMKKADRSKEKLVLSALPLIKTIASNEFKRRRSWGSRITYEDIMQEAIIGFLRGLQSFKIDSNVGSPTNYLGQWITVTIKRKVESLDHDFTIPYEIVERHRRIRAVYTRVANELERDPTDDELLEALNNDSFTNSGTKWAKASKPSDGVSKKVFTMEHIEEYKNMFHKMYAMGTYDYQTSDENDNGYEQVADSIYSETVEDYAKVDEMSLNKSREDFFNKVFIEMRMGSKQRDIILRHFGLNPYGEAQQRKDIVAKTGVSAKFVKTVIEAFMIYMPVRGGIFHKIILEKSMEDIDALELAWILPILGEWPKNRKNPLEPPMILTQPGLKIEG
jgi:DNA-directed RNA polymerase sigma subunit (sigma70/sigma32)